MNNLIPKKIWALWINFFEKTDGILTDDLIFYINRIKYLHQDSEWQVIIITEYENLISLIKDDEYKQIILDVFDNKFVGSAHKSDLIRYYLLKTYGGYWIDISTFLVMSLNELSILNNSSFVCYYAPTIDVS